MYIENATYAQQAECVANLVDKTRNVQDHFEYPAQDARTVVLKNMRIVAYSTQMVLNLLDNWRIGNEGIRQVIPQILGLTIVTAESIDTTVYSLTKSSKLSLILLGQFQIENCLRNLARELNVGAPSQGFYRMAESVVAHLDLPNSLVHELNVAALIRNSLHANGIHFGFQCQDTTETLDPVTYDFRHQQPVTCAGVEHIAHALEWSIGILETIFATPEIVALEDPVTDQYMSEIVANAE